jgi:uncharacterized membrane protein YhhN
MVTRGMSPSTGGVVLKALSIALLAALAFKVLGKATVGYSRLILTAALTLSCVGDVLLAIGPRRYFVHALWVFLLAHVTYVLLFVRCWPRPLRPTVGQLILASLVLGYSLLVTIWLAPALGRLAAPAMFYAVAITAMTLSAILAGFSRPVVWVGAILFMISDSLIAAARFKTGWSPAVYLIWPTYYLGQYGIAIGFLREKAGE